MNENPNERVNPRLRDRLAAEAAGKKLRVVVPGKCKVCRNRSADVPMTKAEVMRWSASRDTTGLPKYAVAMLTTGVHRECQPMLAAKAKEQAAKRANAAAKRGGAGKPIPLDPAVIARRRGRKVA